MDKNQDARKIRKWRAAGIVMAIIMMSTILPAQCVSATELETDEIIVSTEEELIDAVEASSTDESVRTQIVLDTDISVTGKLVIPEGHYVELSGDQNGRKLSTQKKFSDSQLDPAGVILVKGNLIISQLEINGSEKTRPVAVYDGVLVLNADAVLTGNKITKHMNGGGLYIADNTTTTKKAMLTINEGASITNNVFNPSSSVEASGIGLYIEQATVIMNGGEISGNQDLSTPAMRTRAGNGGAVGISGSTASFTMNGGIIENNLVQGNGGAITATNAAKIILNKGKIINNTCYGIGGAVYLTTSGSSGASFEMNGGQISGNKADATNSAPDTDKSLLGSGGAVFIESDSSMVMNGGTISDNTATALPIADTNGLDGGQGGGVYVEGTLSMSGGTITGNSAVTPKSEGYKTGNGGGIAISGGDEPGTVEISGGSIHDNTAVQKGKDLYLNYDKRSANLMSVGSSLLTTEAQGDLVISGNPVIGNIYLPTGVEFTLAGGISDAQISVESESKEIGTVVAHADQYKIMAEDARNLKDENGNNIYNLENGTIVIAGERTYTDLSNAVIAAIEDQIYTGEEIMPEPDVVLEGEQLVSGRDFQFLYSDNLDAGEATVIVSGIGEFSGEAQESFMILPKDLADVTVGEIQPYLSCGTPIIPDLMLMNGSIELTQDTDYTLTCQNNTEPGTAEALVSGKGNYTGSKSITYSIISPEEVVVCADEESLRNAIENNDGSEGNPALIYISDKIVLTKTLVIPEGMYIQIIGVDANAALIGKVISSEENEEDDPLISATSGISKTSMIRVEGNLKISRLTLAPAVYQKTERVRQRVLRVDQNGALTLGNGTVISGGYGYVGSGLLNRGTVQIDGATFANNRLTDMTNGLGGAIVNDQTGTLTITAGTFSDNMSRKGGVLYNAEGAKAYISGGVFQNNQASYDQGSSVVLTGEGAAIYNDKDSYVQISGGTYSNNSADDFGGAIANYGTLELTGGNLAGNTAGKCGGGIYTAGNTVFDDGTIRENTITSSSLHYESADGGGVFVASGTFTMNGGMICDNKVSNDYNSLESFSNAGNGGGVFVSNSADGCQFIMHGGTISGNKAVSYLDEPVTGHGGGVYIAGGSGTAARRNCEPGSISMDGGTITGNTASGTGDGIYISSQCSYNYEENRTTYEGSIPGAASCRLAGEAVIAGNTADNLYLEEDACVLLTKTLQGNVYLTAQKDADAAVCRGEAYQLTQEDADHIYNDETDRSVKLIAEENTIYLWAMHLEDAFELITKEKVFIYTGENVCPEIVIREKEDHDHILEEGSDYTVSYIDSEGKERTASATDDDGEPYRIVVTGCGKYSGSLSKSYRVQPASLSLVEVNLPDQTYTGKAITYVPNLGEIQYEGRSLSRNKDYYIVDGSYRKNISVGTATFQIEGNRDHNGTGSGNFIGTRTVRFNIVSAGGSDIIFTDVQSGHEFYEPIYWAAQKGITTGWSDGTFRPWTTCNRAAVVTFLWRLEGKPEPAKIADFKDMPEDTADNQDFRKAISWAAEEGITTGWEDGTFRPWITCNRAAIMTFIWRSAGKPAATASKFTDPTGNQEFDQAISWASENGIANGWSDGTFRPWNDCNRAAVVAFLYRYANQ